MMRVLILCTGNTCRSPMAELIFRERFPEVHVTSAGISTIDGLPMAMNAQKAVFDEMNIFPNITSKQVTHDMLKEADIVITMTESQKKAVVKDGFSNVYTLKEMAGERGNISDPYGMGYDIYLETFHEIKEAISKIDLGKYDYSR